MKKFLLGAAVLGIAGTASAADMPLKAPIAAPVPVCTWCGFYVGVNGGYGWSAGSKTLTSSITSDFPDFAADGDAVTFFTQSRLNPKGGFGGMQFGYNWQIGGWVWGLEADFQGSAIKASTSHSLTAPFGLDGGVVEADDATVSAFATSRLNAFGTIRGRAGLAWGPALIYGTGGIAYGQVKDTATVTAIDANDPDPLERIRPLSTHTITSETAKVGFVLGGGVEYLLWQSVSLKAEYQYMDLGNTRLFVTSDNGEDHAETTANISHRYHTFRAGLNWRPNWGALAGY